MAITWRENLTITKDPSDVIDYVMDYSGWLTGSDTVSSVVITADTGITNDSSSTTTTTATARMSGGTAGTTYDVAFKMTTAGGQVLERTVRIRVRDL